MFSSYIQKPIIEIWNFICGRAKHLHIWIKLLYSKYYPSYIHKSMIYKDFDLVKPLVENGFDIHTKFERDDTLLSLAAVFSKYEICEYLIEKGADVNNITDSNNNILTNLYMFPFYRNYDNINNNIKIVKLFVNSGCNINHCNNFGITPLINAIRNKNYEICEYLLENGADINYVNSFFETPISVACRLLCFQPYENEDYKTIKVNELYKIIVLLVENGADILKRDDKGRLCTHCIKFDENDHAVNENMVQYNIYMKKHKIKTYLEDKIQEREMVNTCFKRAQVCEDDDTADENL